MSRINLGIVIPTFNAASTISATLDALRPAVAATAKVVVVDGGSTDDTLSIAAGCDVRLQHSGDGLYGALNTGFRSLETEWMTWINADDLLFCDTVATRLADSGDAQVLYGCVDFIDLQGRFMHSWQSAAPGSLLSLYRGGYSPLLQQGTLFHRSVFDTVGGFDASYSFVGDADFWWRALEAGFLFKRQRGPPVAAFRLHERQLSQRYRTAMRQEHATMVANHGGISQAWRARCLSIGWRVGNVPGYLLRALRRRDIEGRARFARSYEVARSIASAPATHVGCRSLDEDH